jgi:hypothetical protein
MDTSRRVAESSTNDSLVRQEVKALIEKLNLVLQVSSTGAVNSPILRQPEDVNDTSSEFSGYSMVTPSATSTVELDQGESLPDQQVQEKGGLEIDGVSQAPQLDSSEYKTDGDIGINKQYGEDDLTAKESPKDDIDVVHVECESSNQKSKLIGMLATFEHPVECDRREAIFQEIAFHLRHLLDREAGDVHVSSIEGQGHLEVQAISDLEPRVHLQPNDSCGKLVANLRCMPDKSMPQDSPRDSARIVSTAISSGLPQILDPVGPPPDLPTYSSPRTELAKARTLRALLDSKALSGSGSSFDKTSQDTAKNPEPIFSNNVPTLSQLIDIAKVKIHRELTMHEHVNSSDSLESTAAVQKTSKIGIKSLKGKAAMHLDRESFLIFSTSALLLTVVSLVICIASMSAKTQGHCVGIWLGA